MGVCIRINMGNFYLYYYGSFCFLNNNSGKSTIGCNIYFFIYFFFVIFAMEIDRAGGQFVAAAGLEWMPT